jgi:ABC-type phosphate/phosphonate transport system permease subunit
MEWENNQGGNGRGIVFYDIKWVNEKKKKRERWSSEWLIVVVVVGFQVWVVMFYIDYEWVEC